MSTAESIDSAVSDAYEAADVAFISASVFPLCDVMAETMGRAEGGPGAIGNAAIDWIQAAEQLKGASQAITQVAGELGTYDWTGSDRDAFDNDVQQLASQLQDNETFAAAVGGVLTALAVPFGIFPPMCLGFAIAMAAIAVAFEAAAASVIGDLGPSEALYATGTEMSVTFNEIIDASVTAIIAMCATATAIMAISDAADVAALENDGDADAGKDFGKAVVNSLGDVAKNLEGYAAGKAADKIGEHATEGLPTGNVAEKAEKEFIKDEITKQYENDNKGAVDLVTGESPSKTIADTLGVSEDDFKPDTEEEVLPENLGELINQGVNWGK